VYRVCTLVIVLHKTKVQNSNSNNNKNGGRGGGGGGEEEDDDDDDAVDVLNYRSVHQ
jgi:hypothetical protein